MENIILNLRKERNSHIIGQKNTSPGGKETKQSRMHLTATEHPPGPEVGGLQPLHWDPNDWVWGEGPKLSPQPKHCFVQTQAHTTGTTFGTGTSSEIIQIQVNHGWPEPWVKITVPKGEGEVNCQQNI